MTLHYKTPEELKSHNRELSRRSSAEYRAKEKQQKQELLADNERLSGLCQRLEDEKAAILYESESIKAAYIQTGQELEILRNAPPKVVTEYVPTKRPPPTNITDIMQMVNYADVVWRGNLTREIELPIHPFLRCPNCGNKDGSFVDKMICY